MSLVKSRAHLQSQVALHNYTKAITLLIYDFDFSFLVCSFFHF